MVKKCKLKNDLICLESVLNQYTTVSFGKLGNTILQSSFAEERAGSDPEQQNPEDMGRLSDAFAIDCSAPIYSMTDIK